MRWLTFIVLAAAAICVQTTCAPALGAYLIVPDFMIILLVHYVLNARSPEGLVAGWLLGLLVDLASVERFGVVTCVYALAAAAVFSIRSFVFREHGSTHFAVTLGACLLVQITLRGYFEFAYPLSPDVLAVFLESLVSALYTALWALLCHRALLRFSATLGLQRGKISSGSVRRMGLV